MNKASQIYKKIKDIPTSDAIDALSKEWFDRKPPKGIRKEKAQVVFFKKAGLFDEIQDTMAPTLWNTKTKKLKPHVRKHILNTLYEYAPKDSIKQVVLIGSTTGLQYHERSDVDVNAVLDPPELVEELWEVRRKYNEKNIPGSQHPLNIYLQPFRGKIPTYQDSYFGVYDVLNDGWLIRPPSKESYRDPEIKFWAELKTARMLANEFIRRADNYERTIEDKRKLDLNKCCSCYAWNSIRIEHRLTRDLKELIAFVEDLEEGRNMAYNIGWGVPRVGYENVLYKFIHFSLPEKYKIILDEVKEIMHESKEENAS